MFILDIFAMMFVSYMFVTYILNIFFIAGLCYEDYKETTDKWVVSFTDLGITILCYLISPISVPFILIMLLSDWYKTTNLNIGKRSVFEIRKGKQKKKIKSLISGKLYRVRSRDVIIYDKPGEYSINESASTKGAVLLFVERVALPLVTQNSGFSWRNELVYLKFLGPDGKPAEIYTLHKDESQTINNLLERTVDDDDDGQEKEVK